MPTELILADNPEKLNSLERLVITFPVKENIDVFRTFQVYLKCEGKALNTRVNYEHVVALLLSQSIKPVSEIKYADIFAFKEKYKLQKKPTSINNLLTILSIFFKYCISEKITVHFPLKLLYWRPKIPDAMPKFLTEDEIARARIALSLNKYSESRGNDTTYLHYRDRVIFEFLLASGMRISELVNLNVEDIDLVERTAIILKAKNKVQRQVNFSADCGFLLKEIIGNKPGKSAVILNCLGDRITRRRAGQIIRKLGKTIGLNVLIGPHILRHSFATRMLKKGAPISSIQTELGHMDAASTQIYCKIPDEQLYILYKNCWGN